MVNRIQIVVKISFFLYLILFSKILSEVSKPIFSGYLDFSYIERQSDRSIINIPYRMGIFNMEREIENLILNTTFALEYHVREDSYFLSSSNPQDFILDMRELYLTYRSGSYEFRMGKQIHSWGSVDENSPLDNASSLDYYYMFFGGTEKKMASLSSSLDCYIGNLTINTVFSPLHSTNRMPLGDDDFPIELPVYPDSKEILPISGKPYEGGIHGTYSTGFGDISLSYFSGYDRIFNLTGVNVYGRGSDISFPYVDIVYSYRKTNVLGLGGVFLSDLFTLRFDLGHFSTLDKNTTIDRPCSFNSVFYDSLHFSYPLHEKSVYQQSTLQIETELPFNISLSAQYFIHDTISYSSRSLPVDQEINIPNLQIDPENLTPSNFFAPGMGVPIAILTNRSVFIVVNREFFSNKLNASLSTMLDIAKYPNISGVAGSLTELKFEYSIMQNLNGLFGITTVKGNNLHPDKELYPFNRMEDFSHTRFEIKYYF